MAAYGRSAYCRDAYDAFRGLVEYFNESLVLEYTAALGAGETICIDASKFTVVSGSTNKLANFSGDFLEIFPNRNKITYEDSETSRAVTVTLTHRDRSI